MKNNAKRSRAEVERQFPIMKEMYEGGYTVNDIANFFCISPSSVHNTFNVMGYMIKKRGTDIDETKLIYADNKPPVLETVVIEGKLYTDITPLFAPR